MSTSGFMNMLYVLSIHPITAFFEIGLVSEKNTQTDVVYLDFAKAFDSVDHLILLRKVRSYGVTGSVLNWFRDYLNGRTQRVIIDGACSKWKHSGFPCFL